MPVEVLHIVFSSVSLPLKKRQKFGDGDNLKLKQFSLVIDELILNFYEAGCPFNAAVFKYFQSVRMLCIQIVIYFGFCSPCSDLMLFINSWKSFTFLSASSGGFYRS